MNSKPKAHSPRDLFGSNGKGDKSRVTDVKKYQENFDAINWTPKPAKRDEADAQQWEEPPTP